MSEAKANKLCPFCDGRVDPQGWLDGNDERGPECEDCGATAPTLEIWNSVPDAYYADTAKAKQAREAFHQFVKDRLDNKGANRSD